MAVTRGSNGSNSGSGYKSIMLSQWLPARVFSMAGGIQPPLWAVCRANCFSKAARNRCSSALKTPDVVGLAHRFRHGDGVRHAVQGPNVGTHLAHAVQRRVVGNAGVRRKQPQQVGPRRPHLILHGLDHARIDLPQKRSVTRQLIVPAEAPQVEAHELVIGTAALPPLIEAAVGKLIGDGVEDGLAGDLLESHVVEGDPHVRGIGAAVEVVILELVHVGDVLVADLVDRQQIEHRVGQQRVLHLAFREL